MNQEILQLTGGGDQLKRRELDFYPTPKNVTIALMDFLFQEDRIDKDFKIWEPACGNGAMSKVIESYGLSVYSSDIRDTGFGSPFLDFTTHKGDSNFDAIITNPPFNLSEKFIRVGLSKSRLVCMLLKSQYWHAKSRVKLFNEFTPCYILPLTWRPDFLEHERKVGDKKGAPTMEVAWSVWIRGINKSCIYKPLLKPSI